MSRRHSKSERNAKCLYCGKILTRSGIRFHLMRTEKGCPKIGYTLEFVKENRDWAYTDSLEGQQSLRVPPSGLVITKECCDNCKFYFQLNDKEDYQGICRRYPPIKVEEEDESQFPVVCFDDWCGEFKGE